jgi:glycosyltransferase involved in cell wall biosynthesis
MRVLIISNLFPPYILGGAEVSTESLAGWLVSRGHEVCVLSSAPRPANAESTVRANGVRIERRYFPNRYSVYDVAQRGVWQKTAWHVRDHFLPESETICREVIESFRPDIVNAHDLQGIGYNILREVGRQGLPCVQTLHDFGFLCVNMNMFQNGAPCGRRHFVCEVSGMVKRAYFSAIPRLSFWSPSRALMDIYRPSLPSHLEAVAIPLPLFFSQPEKALPLRASARGGLVRLLFVGQVTEAKGIEFVLRILEPLAALYSFEIVIVGSGPILGRLKERYERAAWVKFAGRVPPGEVAAYMTSSDLMVFPSLWFENAPLVVRQANQLGLPILASGVGGIPELVGHGVNGVLLAPGDEKQWQGCLGELLSKPEKLQQLGAGARENASDYDPDLLGEAVLRLFERTIGRDGIPVAVPPREAVTV